MKLTLKTPKPRNPFVAASLRRVAGAHRSGALRQAGRRDLQREITASNPAPDP